MKDKQTQAMDKPTDRSPHRLEEETYSQYRGRMEQIEKEDNNYLKGRLLYSGREPLVWKNKKKMSKAEKKQYKKEKRRFKELTNKV